MMATTVLPQQSQGSAARPSAFSNHDRPAAEDALQSAAGKRDSMSPPHRRELAPPPSGASSTTKRRPTTTGPVRRRISRACDQCNQLRTKCDGRDPCAHCVEFGLTCEYVRERKKRGKVSRKDLARQQAAAVGGAGSVTPGVKPEGTANGPTASSVTSEPQDASVIGVAVGPRVLPSLHNLNTDPRPAMDGGMPYNDPYSAVSVDGGMPNGNSLNMLYHQQNRPNQAGFGVDQQSQQAQQQTPLHNGGRFPQNRQGVLTGPVVPPSTIHAVAESMYAQSNRQDTPTAFSPYRSGNPESPFGGFMPMSPPQQSQWMSLPASSAFINTNSLALQAPQLRYPVLQPLVNHLNGILPLPVACDLLELYFSSTTTAFLRPASPYILGFVFRKRSFLRQNNPRVCTPALLASMLWVAAQTSESAFFTSPPSARGKICQKLLELVVSLLKPLIHMSMDGADAQPYGPSSVLHGLALGGFGLGMSGVSKETEMGTPSAHASVDDVVTYIHLATVVSAGEYKAASLRWWNASWSLARELKLGRELPENVSEVDPTLESSQARADGLNGEPPAPTTEEEREERRRAWWLLYSVDRHLALCYNRPLFLLDVECNGLHHPVDDTVWQQGETYAGPYIDTTTPNYRRRGPTFECTGHSIFGFFTPLMTILGEIVELNQARNHPTFGARMRSASDWDGQTAEITRQLEAYGRSLKDFETRFTAIAEGSNSEVGTPATSSTIHNEMLLQTKTVVAYGTHLMHTLHILLNGKWDPISLLDDNDLWISSQSFLTATGHAVSAAEAIDEILDCDPDISFMPWLFGIYLLQGSFLLLLIADKLQGEASPSVVKACETIVRAHEACVVTLNTEYQRNFRKVMRSALAQVRGRVGEDFGEQQLKRREVLSLYRWTGDGTGLAL